MTPPAYHAHPEYLAHLAGIRANPDDDLPRLVLADWLEENGAAERAAYIRAAVAGVLDLMVEIYERSRELWVPEVFTDLGSEFYSQDKWDRGFMREVRLSFASWLTHADRIMPESVGLTVRLTDNPVLDTYEYRQPRDGSGPSVTRIRFVGGPEIVVETPGPHWHWTGEKPDDADNADNLLGLLWPDVAKWELPPERDPVIHGNLTIGRPQGVITYRPPRQ